MTIGANWRLTSKMTCSRKFVPMLAATAIFLAALPGAPAYALSELKKETPPPAATPPANPTQPAQQTEPATPPNVEQPAPAEEPEATETAPQVPLPDPIVPTLPSDDAAPGEEAPTGDNVDPDATPDKDGQLARPDIDPNAPLPEIQHDVEKLPEPVKRMRNLLVEACKSGEIDKLKPIIGTGKQTQLSFGDIEGDPITYLKSLSGDSDGVEILAIMEEVLNAGYVHLNVGKPDEIYVWPYFFGLPLDKLTPPQKVELFKIVTAGDYEEMKGYDSYLFYRLGIRPDGQWAFFIAGE